jgi:hypothetical protein
MDMVQPIMVLGALMDMVQPIMVSASVEHSRVVSCKQFT